MSARALISRGYALSLLILSAAYIKIALDSHSSKSPSRMAGTEALGFRPMYGISFCAPLK